MPFLVGLLTPLFVFIASMIRGIFVVGIGLAIAKVITWLGVGYITYSGVMYGIDYFVTIIQDELLLIPAEFRQLFSAVATDLRLNTALSLVLSAYSIKMTVFVSGKFTSTNLSASV